MEETRLFFDQRLGPNDFTNMGPRRSPTPDFGGLIKDVRQKNIGFSHNAKAMEPPREYKHLGNLPGQESGGEYESKWGLFRQRPKAYKFIPLIDTGKKGIQNLQGNGWQTQNPEQRHPVLVKFMAKFLQKYSTPYFSKVMVAGNKTTKYFPKYGGNLHGKRDMCMHQIMAKCRNPNF